MFDVHSWANHRARRRLRGQAEAVAEAAHSLRAESDVALRSRFTALRAAPAFRLDALACAVESARRTLSIEPRRPQIEAAVLLQDRKAVELDTGEGKTLALALAAAPLALTHGVHLVTANEYLASRDAETMGPLYSLLGLSAGADDGRLGLETRRAHRSDVVYINPRSLAFHVLRDGLRRHALARIVGPHAAILIDELDSVLVDAASAPFAISAPSERDDGLLLHARDVVEVLVEGTHYDVRAGAVELTSAGADRAHAELASRNVSLGETLYHEGSFEALHRLDRALVAHAVLRRDRDYLVTDDGRVVLLDARTGRRLETSRLRDGLHAAVAAKERVELHAESGRAASVTVRALVSRYTHLSGASGTLVQARGELEQIYGLEVVRVPPHRPPSRVDHATHLYATEREKLAALVERVGRAHAERRPVLVGAQSIEEVEAIARALALAGVPAQKLTARNLEIEAEVFGAAGREAAVTVATQLAGRGVDIRLGHDDVSHRRLEEAGGLLVVGATRNVERRIDRQLRGRAARGGERGESVFFASADEPLMKRLATERELRLIEAAARRGGGVASAVERTLARIQRRSERTRAAHRASVARTEAVIDEVQRAHFAIREASFAPNAEGVEADPRLVARVLPFVREIVGKVVTSSEGSLDLERARRGVRANIARRFGLSLSRELLSGPPGTWQDEVHLVVAGALTVLRREIVADADALGAAARPARAELDRRIQELGPAILTRHHRQHLLGALDEGYVQLAAELTEMRDSVGLLAYGVRRPLDEFRRRAFEAFERMRRGARAAAVERLLAEPTSLERVRELEGRPAEGDEGWPRDGRGSGAPHGVAM